MTDSSAHLDKPSTQHRICSNSEFDLHSFKNRITVVFETVLTTYFVHTAMVLGQPAGLFKVTFLYASAAWQSSSVSQRVAGGPIENKFTYLRFPATVLFHLPFCSRPSLEIPLHHCVGVLGQNKYSFACYACCRGFCLRNCLLSWFIQLHLYLFSLNLNSDVCDEHDGCDWMNPVSASYEFRC